MRSLLRAILARCPICGAKEIWKSFGQTVDNCPQCGYRYAREEGYWVGGLIVNIGVGIGLFFLVFAGGLVLTWPNVPWTALLIVNIIVMGLAPVLLYRQSKTIWVRLDLKIHPYEVEERDWDPK